MDRENKQRRYSIDTRIALDDLPELQEINFMTTEKSVKVRRTSKGSSTYNQNDLSTTMHSKFIKVINESSTKNR